MIRVIPRDLFNDANLLKCLGQLALLELDGKLPGFRIEHDGEAFCIEQDESEGSTYADNVQCVTDSGRMVGLRRPLNSRSSWPLMASLYDTDEVSVFDDAGNPTPEFLAMGETP